MIDASPDLIGRRGAGKDFIGVGLWLFSAETKLKVARITKIGPEIFMIWFDKIFGKTKGDYDIG